MTKNSSKNINFSKKCKYFIYIYTRNNNLKVQFLTFCS